MARNEILKFRVTPSEKERITENALSSYRTISMYLRDCALGNPIVVVNGADAVADELRRIGNNLNQITRAVNGGYITAVDLTGVKEEIKTIWQLLNSLHRDVR